MKGSLKIIIFNVYHYFEKQSTSKSLPPKLCKKTADATVCTINRVVAENGELESMV